MSRALGYLPSSAHPTLDRSPVRLLGAHMGLAPSSSDGLRACFGAPPDQIGQSCVGEALAAAVAAVARASGHACVEVSPLHLYALARSADGMLGADIGSRPALALAAAQALGYCALSVWPREDALLDGPPGSSSIWDVERVAIDQAGLGWYLLDCDGEERCEAIRVALSRGHGVVLAVDVDAAFEDWDSAAPWPGPRGEILGGHYLPQSHYDADGLWHRGSWGPGWGAGGWGRIAWDVVASPTISEVRIVTAAKPAKPVEAA